MPRRTALALAAAATAAAIAAVAGPLLAQPTTMTTTMPATQPTTAATAAASPPSINGGVEVGTMSAPAPEDPAAAKIYEAATPSLVPVQYTYTGETEQTDLILPGIVVDEQGLVMIPLAAVSEGIPDEYLKKFKVIIPHDDRENEELPAEFQGRDDRAMVAFVKPKNAKGHTWKPVRFTRVSPPLGQTVYSVGLSQRSANYHTVLTKSTVSAYFRGAEKQVQVTGGGLANAGSPVFLADGSAIGIVTYAPSGELLLGDRDQRTAMIAGLSTNRLYTPTDEFAVGLEHPPSVGRPIPMAYTGLTELAGLKKDEAAFFGLTDKPAIQIGDMLPDSPSVKGGLKKKDIITAVDGQPLERGDLPEELPGILRRHLSYKRPGDVVTFTVVRDKGKPPVDVKVTLEPRPMLADAAARYWNDDIGFGVRQMVPTDRYAMHLKPAEKDGVLVTVLKEGGAAGNGGLRQGDMITQINGKPVASLPSFKDAFESFRKEHEHQPIVMLVHRGNADQTIRIEPPQ